MPKRDDNKFSPLELKIRLLRRGLTVTCLANLIGKRRQSVSSSINGSKRYPRVLRAIMEELR